MASLTFRTEASISTNSSTGIGSGTEILGSGALPGPVVGTVALPGVNLETGYHYGGVGT